MNADAGDGRRDGWPQAAFSKRSAREERGSDKDRNSSVKGPDMAGRTAQKAPTMPRLVKGRLGGVWEPSPALQYPTLLKAARRLSLVERTGLNPQHTASRKPL